MKELFVFGAGASNASGGTPLGKDLVWDYFYNTHGLYQMGDNGKVAPEELDEIHKEYINFEEFLNAMDKIFPGILVRSKWHKSINEASIFNHAFVPSKKYYIDEVMAELIHRNDNKNIHLIKKLAVEHIAKSPRGRQNSLYKKIAENFKIHRRDDVSIISLNFDCLLCDDFVENIYFDYCINFHDLYEEARLYKKPNGIPLIKLNGSIDWAKDKNNDTMSLLPPYASHLNYKNKNFEPYIFLPHQQKEGIISSLWERACQEIRTADKINIIGYSFPNYDKDIINLFSNNIRKDTKIEVSDIIDIADLRIKYKKLFPKNDNVIIFADGFDGFVERLSQKGERFV